jgi:hypothetical protein
MFLSVCGSVLQRGALIAVAAVTFTFEFKGCWASSMALLPVIKKASKVASKSSLGIKRAA